jgi:hypothetical protein
MATSPLDPGSTENQRDRILRRGHGTSALGPSDSSDSGSDVQGGDADTRIGDAELDSDTDRSGTGERLGATPDTEMEEGGDIAPDRVEKATSSPPDTRSG